MQEFGERGFIVVPRAVGMEHCHRANAAIASLLATEPPPTAHTGQHFYWRDWPAAAAEDPFVQLLMRSGAFAAAGALVAPGVLDTPELIQIALTLPPFDHRPGGHHIDGVAPTEGDGRPGTFTLLAGVILSDQTRDDMGNLWVWPGTHLTHAEYFRSHGPDALLASKAYTPIALPAPEQVHGHIGDLLLAHYMLAHNIGGNTSKQIRRMVYYRLRRAGHRQRWRDCIQDALLEFDAVRNAQHG